MQVKQLSVRYIAEQDRLLLLLNTADGEEYRLWLTRRMLHTIWPHLNELGRSGRAANDFAPDEAGRQALGDFRKDQALQQSDFNTPFNTQPLALPLGDQPLLVTHTHFAVTDKGQLDIMFEEVQAEQLVPRGFTARLTYQLLVGMMRLMEKALDTADWRLDGPPSKAAAAAEADANVVVQPRPRYLN